MWNSFQPEFLQQVAITGAWAGEEKKDLYHEQEVESAWYTSSGCQTGFGLWSHDQV